ncbi:MAG TPA: hypothetical protein VLE53_11220 [Gemmatimonadaceae bacterium]|nr:hypothetical protein [Gemmatimonadaceae bacterium]
MDLGVTVQISFQVPFVASDGAGTLVFAPGEGEAARLELAILDRRGEVVEKFAPDLAASHPRAGPRFSPDGRRIALEMAPPGELSSDIWVYDRTSSTALRLTTWPTPASWPSWAPDGRTIVYSARRDSTASSQALFVVPADGSGSPRLLREAPEQQRDGEWTPDGRAYVMRRRTGERSADAGDIVLLTFGDGVVHERVLLGSPASELHPDVSPDGRFLAYTSDETGRNEVYVTPLPGPGPRIPVSQNGGRYPRWTRNGRELVYSVQQSLWAARMDLSGAAPRVIRRDSLMRVGGVALQRLSLGVPYDVTPDGEQFAVLTAPVARRLVVWQGWQNRRLAPP